MISAISSVLAVIAAISTFFAARYINKAVASWYGKYRDKIDREQIEAGKKKAEEDNKKANKDNKDAQKRRDDFLTKP